jgi:cytochrome c-type biogenesis protein CcmF
MAGGMLTPVLLGSAALAVVAGVAYGDFNWAVLATFLLAAWVLLAGCATSSTRPATRA